MVNQILLKIREYSSSQGNLPACRFLEQQICWTELEERTNWIASNLKNRFQIIEQTPIIIYHARGIEFIVYMIAALKCGCFYIPLEHSTPVDRVKNIYEDVCAGIIITDRADLFDGDVFNTFSFDNWDIPVPNYAKTYDIEEINDTDLVYCIYTSGTSGKPKGVKIMYRNLINLVESFHDILYHRFYDVIRVGMLASFSFDSSVKQIYCSLFYGHTLCIAESVAQIFGQKLQDFFMRYDVTICDMTPSHLKLIYLQKVQRFSKIPYLLVGGEILCWEQLHAYIRQANYCPSFINLYGPTECCVDVAYKVISQEELSNHKSGIVPIGRELRNTNLILRSEEQNTIKEVYIEGELFVTGKQVGAGYVNLKTDVFKEENGLIFYKTGDIAYYDSNQEIVIVGRKDQQVKVNGHRVELREIQTIIEDFIRCPCVVLCVESEKSSKIVVFICKEKDDAGEKSKLIEYLQRVLPRYMIPHYIMFSVYMPLTNNGKIDSKQLKEMLIGHM